MKIHFLGFFLLSTILSCAPSGKLDMSSGKEVARVNGTVIGQSYLDTLVRLNPKVEAQLKNPITKNKIVENLVEQELLYQESVKRGIDKDPKVLEKSALYRRVIIAQALLENELEKSIKDEYEKKKDTDYTKVGVSQIEFDFQPEEVTPKQNPHVPAKTEEKPATEQQKKAALVKASLVASKLKAGEDFAKLAGEISDDKMSKRKGGDIGKISRGDKRLERMGLEALTEKAFSLKKDEISEPIESKKGYHIIKVTTEAAPIPYEEAEKLLRFEMQKTVKDELVAKLKGSSEIKFAEKPREAPVNIQAPQGANAPVGVQVGAPPAPLAPTPSHPPVYKGNYNKMGKESKN